MPSPQTLIGPELLAGLGKEVQANEILTRYRIYQYSGCYRNKLWRGPVYQRRSISDPFRTVHIQPRANTPASSVHILHIAWRKRQDAPLSEFEHYLAILVKWLPMIPWGKLKFSCGCQSTNWLLSLAPSCNHCSSGCECLLLGDMGPTSPMKPQASPPRPRLPHAHVCSGVFLKTGKSVFSGLLSGCDCRRPTSIGRPPLDATPVLRDRIRLCGR